METVAIIELLCQQKHSFPAWRSAQHRVRSLTFQSDMQSLLLLQENGVRTSATASITQVDSHSRNEGDNRGSARAHSGHWSPFEA